MLELAHKKLYWPKPDKIWTPSGSGPKVYAELAREKIGEKIKRQFPKDAKGVKVSVLAANPEGDETEAPLAIVCQFSKSVSSAIIKEVHRLAWSFSRARSLITIEPHLLRVWSCCEPPTEKDELNEVISLTEANLSEQAANALQWVELVSGQFFQAHENRFKRSGAADQMLLDNLKEVREQLQKDGLDIETIHDLLARIIFIQFLFQKQDSQRTRFLNEHILEGLHTQRVLSKSYRELPQLILKQSWKALSKRFQAAIIEPDEQTNRGIICSESCVTVHTSEDHIDILKAACLIYNSKLAVYYLFLSNGFFASYRPKVTVNDLLNVPIPIASNVNLDDIKTYNDVDNFTNNLFSLKDSESVLVNDLFNYTLPDFKGGSSSPGRQRTNRLKLNLLESDNERELKEYCDYFLCVIKAGFGQDKKVCATIFQEATNDYLPVRLVAIYLNKSIHEGIKIQTINSQNLLKLLNELNNSFMAQPNSDTGGIFYQRVARLYTSTEWHGEQVPTVYLIKPDKIRYWTRSMALRDADEVSADIMLGRTELSIELEIVPQ